MNHQSCDLCGRELQPKTEVRYEVRIEVKAAYDPLEITEEDLAQNFRTEIAKVLRQLEGISEEEAQNEVYRQFDFDLCVACQRKYVRRPLPRVCSVMRRAKCLMYWRLFATSTSSTRSGWLTTIIRLGPNRRATTSP